MQLIHIKDRIDAAVLGSREERVELLRAGFTGKEIEALYVMLNSFDVVACTGKKMYGNDLKRVYLKLCCAKKSAGCFR